MGDTSMNVGIMNFAESNQGLININIRYPKSITATEILDALNSHINPAWEVEFIEEAHNQPPHYVDPSDPLVETLLGVYAEQTGLPTYDQVIGGGTYGRLMKRGVAFGALFEGDQDTMHQVDEFMPLNRIEQSTAIYAEAIYKVSNLD
jgi:D-alanyl-D-alanine dipeptidase